MKSVKRMAQFLVFATMLLVTAAALPVSALTMREAVAALERGDYAMALAGFRILRRAGRGDGSARAWKHVQGR